MSNTAFSGETLMKLAHRAVGRFGVPERWRDDAIAEYVAAAFEAGQSAQVHGNRHAYQCRQGQGAIENFVRRERRKERYRPAQCPAFGQRVSLNQPVKGQEGEVTRLGETVVDHRIESPSARMEKVERERSVQTAIANLPDLHRRATSSTWVHGRQELDVAKALHITRHRLRNVLSQAREWLRKALWAYRDETKIGAMA